MASDKEKRTEALEKLAAIATDQVKTARGKRLRCSGRDRTEDEVVGVEYATG